MRSQLGGIFAAVAIGVASGTQACGPIWVRPVDVSRYSAALVGRVQRVDWFRGRIRVASTRVLTGRPTQNVDIEFNNIPLTCGWQLFLPGDKVYVLIEKPNAFSWAARLSDVTFESDEARK